MSITQNLPHLITFTLWCLLIPGSILMIIVSPSQVRLNLFLELGQFLFLSFLLFYTWSYTRGTNEVLIDLLIRLYMAVDASLGAFAVEHWHLLGKGSAGSAKQSAPSDGSGAKIVAVSPKLDRSKYLVFTITTLVFYWGWLIFGFTQLHLQ